MSGHSGFVFQPGIFKSTGGRGLVVLVSLILGYLFSPAFVEHLSCRPFLPVRSWFALLEIVIHVCVTSAYCRMAKTYLFRGYLLLVVLSVLRRALPKNIFGVHSFLSFSAEATLSPEPSMAMLHTVKALSFRVSNRSFAHKRTVSS